tara:strand:- start:230 stop:1615 length:1386 start_codon:yes stop_codon:yes gene_type:complete
MSAKYERIDVVGERVLIIKRFDSKNYYARYHDNTGKRNLKSLKTTNLKQARINAQKILRSLEDNTHDRIEEVRVHRQVSLRDAVDDYISKCTNAPHTLREKKSCLDYICGDLDGQHRYPVTPLAQRSIQSITTKELQNWMSEESKRYKWKSATQHQYINALRQVFKHAVGQNWALSNVAAELIKPPKSDEVIPEALDDETIERLFEILPTYAMYIMALLLETGLRKSELHRLTWGDVNTSDSKQGLIDAKSLLVRKSKSKQFRVVPLSNKAIEIFDHLRLGSTFHLGDAPLRFLNGDTKLTAKQRDAFIKRLKYCPFKCSATKKAGEQYCPRCVEAMAEFDISHGHGRKLWRERNKKRNTISWPSDAKKSAVIIPEIDIKNSLKAARESLGIDKFHAHQMRHTWATRLLEADINEPSLMRIGGWSDHDMVRRYAKVNVEKVAPKFREALAERTGGIIRPTQ